MGYSLSEQLELHIINYWIMWSVSKSPIGCNILPKCLSAVITDTKISSHSGRLTIIVTQFVTNIKAPLGNYEIPISGLRIGGTIYIYLERQSDCFSQLSHFIGWKCEKCLCRRFHWFDEDLNVHCTRSQVMSLDLTTYLQQRNQIHFVRSRQRHNFAESSAIESTNQSVVHWYFTGFPFILLNQVNHRGKNK